MSSPADPPRPALRLASPPESTDYEVPQVSLVEKVDTAIGDVRALTGSSSRGALRPPLRRPTRRA